MEDTVDNALAPVEKSMQEAELYSPDNPNSTAIVQRKLDADGNIINEVDHGNGVKSIATEAARVAVSTVADVAYEGADLFTDINEGTDNLLVKMHPLLAYTAYKAKDVYENKQDFLGFKFQPKTKTGKAIRDIGSELLLMFGGLQLMKANRFLQGVPKYGQKAKKYFHNLAKASMRWGIAEGTAAGIARDNESEPFALMLTDITGITDETQMQNVRELYQDALSNGDDFNDFRLRAVKSLDGFATAATLEVLMTVLGSTFKAHRAFLGTGVGTSAAVGASITAEQLQTQNQLTDINNDRIINEQFKDLMMGPTKK